MRIPGVDYDFTDGDDASTLRRYNNHPSSWLGALYPPKPTVHDHIEDKGIWIAMCEGIDAGLFIYYPETDELQQIERSPNQ